MLEDESDEPDAAGVGTPLIDAESVAGAHTSAGLDGVAPGAVQASRADGSAAGAAANKAAIDDYKPVSYNYSFFHLIFALASMYIAMLMTGWGAVEQERDRWVQCLGSMQHICCNSFGGVLRCAALWTTRNGALFVQNGLQGQQSALPSGSS